MSSGGVEIHDFVSGRFRSERRRLDLTHSEVAKITGYSRISVIAWEKGGAMPCTVLGLLYPYGFDAQFVCTGVRSSNAGSENIGDSPVLTSDEWKLVKRFRLLADHQRTQALAMLEVLNAGIPLAGNATVISGDNKRVAGRDYNDNRAGRSKKDPK